MATVRVMIALVAMVSVFVAALWPVYVRPRVEQPRTVDAIVVLGGAHDGREELGLRLGRAGYAPLVVFSNPYVESPMLSRICHGGYSFQVECFRPEPPTTRGEAAYIAGRGWRSIMVVTFTPHISRARYIIQKCFDGELAMIDVAPELSAARWAFNYLYQSAGYTRALFETCRD